MGLVHHPTNGLVVALFECFAHREHTTLFTYNITGTLVILLRDLVTHGLELLHRGSTQELLTQGLRHTLARETAIVVGRAGELVLHTRIEQHQLVALGVEGIVFELHRATIKAHQTTGLAKDRGKLIHDATLHTAVVVLGRLTDAGQLEAVDATPKEVVQGKGEGRLQRSRRRHARTQGDITREDGIETANRVATLLHLACYTEDVVRPRSRRLVLLFEAELGTLIEVERHDPNLVGSVRADGRHDSFIDSSREDVAAIIIGMFANEVNTAGRGEERSSRTERSFESAADLFLHLLHG